MDASMNYNDNNGYQLRDYSPACCSVQGHIGVFPYVGNDGENPMVVCDLQAPSRCGEKECSTFQGLLDLFRKHGL